MTSLGIARSTTRSGRDGRSGNGHHIFASLVRLEPMAPGASEQLLGKSDHSGSQHSYSWVCSPVA